MSILHLSKIVFVYICLNLLHDIQALMFSFFHNKRSARALPLSANHVRPFTARMAAKRWSSSTMGQRAARDRTWRTWGSVWGTGSSCCRPTPSRTTTPSRRPEWPPAAPPPPQVGRFKEGVSKHSDAAANKDNSVEKPAGEEVQISHLCLWAPPPGRISQLTDKYWTKRKLQVFPSVVVQWVANKRKDFTRVGKLGCFSNLMGLFSSNHLMN